MGSTASAPAQELRYVTVRQLLQHLLDGAIRIPEFERSFRWDSEQIRLYLDSLYHGLAVTPLVFFRKDAPSDRITFGPIGIDAQAQPDALWIVDGLQRMTAMTGVLLHPPNGSKPSQDPFLLFFDLERESFENTPGRDNIPTTWLPLSAIHDSGAYTRWQDAQRGRPDSAAMLEKSARFFQRLLNQPLPLLILDSEEPGLVRTLFTRLNSKGLALNRAEMLRASASVQPEAAPADVDDLATRLRAMEYGIFGTAWLRKALRVVQDLKGQAEPVLPSSQALSETEAAVRSVTIFLKRDVGIPNIQLVPSSAALLPLVRFFQLHPTPGARSRELLARWLWREAILEAHGSRVLKGMDAAIDAISKAEERSVQALLASLPARSARCMPLHRFDVKTPLSKLQMLAMLALCPRSLLSGEVIDTTSLLKQRISRFVQPILLEHPPAERLGAVEIASTATFLRTEPANRIIHPRVEGPLRAFICVLPDSAMEILASHAITPEALKSLRDQETLRFLELRGTTLRNHLSSFLGARARWDASDRPSIQALIISDDED